MQVIVKLIQSYVPLETRFQPRSQVPAQLLDIVSSFGLDMQPMHPDTDDASLMSYYFVEVPDPKTGSRLTEKLLQSQFVDGAYVKPSDALP